MSGAFPFFWRNDMRRPINPIIPYPHEAIQHTRCVLALSMITVALSLLKPETLPQLGDLGRQVKKAGSNGVAMMSSAGCLPAQSGTSTEGSISSRNTSIPHSLKPMTPRNGACGPLVSGPGSPSSKTPGTPAPPTSGAFTGTTCSRC